MKRKWRKKTLYTYAADGYSPEDILYFVANEDSDTSKRGALRVIKEHKKNGDISPRGNVCIYRVTVQRVRP